MKKKYMYYRAFSENEKIKYFKKNNVDLYRINLSHTKFKI